MTDWLAERARAERVSRWMAGELSAEEAAALQADPVAVAMRAALDRLDVDLGALADPPPPPGLVEGVLTRAQASPEGPMVRRAAATEYEAGLTAPPRRRAFGAAWWALAAAAFAVLWIGLTPGPERATLRALAGDHVVSGFVDVNVGDVVVAVDGEARVVVEPPVALARGAGAEEVPMRWSHGGAALVGALVTVTVYEGRAAVTSPGAAPVVLSAGQGTALRVGGVEAEGGSPPPDRAASGAEVLALRTRVAELEAALAAASATAAVARGQLAVEQGEPSPWPADLPAALRPDAFEATLRAALDGADVQIELIDCAEYPCVAVLRPPTVGPEVEPLIDGVVARLEGAVPSLGVTVSASRLRDDDGEVGMIGLALGGAGLEPGGPAAARTDWRTRTLSEDAARAWLEARAPGQDGP